ncbi:unnamed protein product [Nippostrongylus brasiliensis]|uniref:Peptidase_M1 domain-containing protein n=1 Tax=Nippostrongylus brasiliensis TaxID=27835 RepID=A0A0N4YF64_NIPBR|nr:unnamed protein product [Nippostrongylus brasiliensis]
MTSTDVTKSHYVSIFDNVAHATASLIFGCRRSSQLRMPSLAWMKRVTPSIFLSILRCATQIVCPSCLRSAQDSDAYGNALKTVEWKRWTSGHYYKPVCKQSLANVSSYRLPRNILPSQYVLKIKMYLPSYKDVPPEKKLTFDGQLELAMQVHSPTRMLALNSKGLTFHSYVLEQDGRTIGIKDMAILKEYEQVHFSIDEELTEGSELRFRVEYSGVIASKILVGLYQTVYTVGDVKKDQSGNWLTSTFEVTPVMSSYLAAMFVSEFAFVEKMSKNQIRFRIWSNPESKHKLKYALEIGIRCLDFLEDFFGIKFPLSKQEDASIVSNCPERSRKFLILIFQWFGNLVTMKWWDDLWLNEGFAAFMEHNVLEGVTGDPVEIDNLILEKLEIALREDSTASSHPLSFKVVSPSDAQAGFSAVTYKKGASVIRMIQKVMGNESFREGLQFYLRKFSYKNARADDLWESLGTAISGMSGPNGQPLVMKTFAEQWTTQVR